ncbi:MAG: DNA polymerase IV, partial [Patescibacteria group bacterium]
MHIDLNSCFATIEQQANPFLRGKPIAVGAYTTPNGCILAASVEAKRLGIKTGMRVKDGKVLYPKLIVLPSDPNKYRDVHLKLRKIISEYTNDFSPKSIDEFV